MLTSPDRHADLLCHALAQGGYVTAAQVISVGFTRDDVCRLLRDNVLTRCRRGLFRVVDLGLPGVWEDRISEAMTAVGPDAVLARESAARWHGIEGGPFLTAVTLAVPPHRRPRRIPGVDVMRADLPSADIDMTNGTRVAVAARAVIDCARYGDELPAVCLAESAARQDMVTISELTARLDALPRAPGVGRARTALARVDLRSESPLETALRLLLLDSGLPYPELQLPFDEGGLTGRLDLAYVTGGRRYVGLAIEADGREPHERDARFHHDRRRHTILEEARWLVRRFTDEHVRLRPHFVVTAVRRALAQASES